jgi:hypothetical protein
MTIQNINVGNIANDGTGDDLRDAFIKVNQNFQELDSAILELKGNNLGSAGAEVFASVQNGQFNFRRIQAGENITVEQLDNTIKVTASQLNRTITFSTEDGSIVVVNSGAITLQGDSNILTKASNNTGVIDISLREDVSKYLNFDFGVDFGKTKTSILDFVVSSVGVDFGTLVDPTPYNVDLGEL